MSRKHKPYTGPAPKSWIIEATVRHKDRLKRIRSPEGVTIGTMLADLGVDVELFGNWVVDGILVECVADDRSPVLAKILRTLKEGDEDERAMWSALSLELQDLASAVAAPALSAGYELRGIVDEAVAARKEQVKRERPIERRPNRGRRR